jgi:2,3-bisphosphoglycerate-independent phosphoglycerate mutase
VAEIQTKLIDHAYLILRDHPVNEERLAAGKKPANCVWLWGEGRALPWPSLAERYRLSGSVVATSDVHRGVGLCAGLDAPDPDRLSTGDLRTRATVALEAFAKKDFVYVHAGLTDEVIHGTDIKARVGGIEEFDRELVGPLMDGLEKQGPYRFLVVCDHGEGVQGQAFYAFGSGGHSVSEAGRRFTEHDAQLASTPARDATKFVAKLFSKG